MSAPSPTIGIIDRPASERHAAPVTAPERRLRRLRAWGPRCPQCAGPLVFGEGCSLCPVCGHSSCIV